MPLIHHLRLARHIGSTHLPKIGKWLAPKKSKHHFYLLLEYPKCGRTWLRFMINQAETRVSSVPLINTLHGVNYPEHHLPRVRYVHGFRIGTPLTERSTGLITRPIGLKGIILMVRQPEQVMVSYYYQSVYRQQDAFSGTISQFVRDQNYGINAYVTYLEFYLKRLEDKKYLVVKYEELKKNTRSILNNTLNFIDINIDDAEIDEIVEASSFLRMQSFEQAGYLNPSWIRPASPDKRASKLRSGGASHPKDHLSAGDLNYIRQAYTASWAFQKLGYL